MIPSVDDVEGQVERCGAARRQPPDLYQEDGLVKNQPPPQKPRIVN